MNGSLRVLATKTAPAAAAAAAAAAPAAAAASLALLLLPSCARVKVDPIEVKPIHIVHDINIRVDRQLDEFFAFQEKMASTTQPATAQTAGASTAQGVTP